MEEFGLRFAGRAAALAQIHTAPAAILCAADGWDPQTPARHAWIAGDNLSAMKLLSPAYAGRVDCIYIDPPYNTGHDFVYRDRWAQTTAAYLVDSGQQDEAGSPLVANPNTSGRYHSAWLAMMLPRLAVARQLLTDDGVIFVSIDDHEVAHLRLLLDEVFGHACFIGQIIVVSNRGGRDYLRIATTHEYILCYGASPTAPVAQLPRPPAAGARTDDRGVYELRELRNRNPKFSPANRPNLAYPIFVDPASKDDANGTFAVAVAPFEGAEEIIPRASNGAGSVWRWGKPKLAAALVPGDPAASEVVARPVRGGGWRVFEKSRKQTTKARSIWDDPAFRSERGTSALRELMGAAVFDHPKPVELVARCLELGMPRDGLALDFFAGAGTTAHAAAWLNARDGGARRTVCITLDEPVPPDSVAATRGFGSVAEIGRARARRVMPEGMPLRTFDIAPAHRGVPASAWHIAVAAGSDLLATPRALGPDAWQFTDPDGRPHVVFTGPRLPHETLLAWGLPEHARLCCRAEALDDATTLYAARRFTLQRTPEP